MLLKVNPKLTYIQILDQYQDQIFIKNFETHFKFKKITNIIYEIYYTYYI